MNKILKFIFSLFSFFFLFYGIDKIAYGAVHEYIPFWFGLPLAIVFGSGLIFINLVIWSLK